MRLTVIFATADNTGHPDFRCLFFASYSAYNSNGYKTAPFWLSFFLCSHIGELMSATNIKLPNDLFVSYSQADRGWVEGYLLDALQAANVSVISELNFALGAPRISELERAVEQSKRTLPVLSARVT